MPIKKKWWAGDGTGTVLFSFVFYNKMYIVLKTSHLVQLLTAFYSYRFTSNMKQFARASGLSPAAEGFGRGHFLCVSDKWVLWKCPSSPQPPSPLQRNLGIYKWVHYAGWHSEPRVKFVILRVRSHVSIEDAPPARGKPFEPPKRHLESCSCYVLLCLKVP